MEFVSGNTTNIVGKIIMTLLIFFVAPARGVQTDKQTGKVNLETTLIALMMKWWVVRANYYVIGKTNQI